MHLIKCYIENFGKLHKFEYHFNEGINTINELNGWGKTTFAAFIKSMFYGLTYTTKRSVDENERKKYTPWQGGKFGGYLDFEFEGMIYRIERFFGAKDKEDTFVLYNQNTQLESKDFTENIGEEIFKINMEAYERSTYIPQSDLKININDSLNAKLSNLIENTNDINNYETAVQKLEKKMKFYQKVGDKGKIAEIRDELYKVSREIERCIEAEKAILGWEERKLERVTRKDQLEKQLEEIKKKILKASEYEGKLAKKQHYDDLYVIMKRIEGLIKEKQEFFKEKQPSEEEIKEQAEYIEVINENKRKLIDFNIQQQDIEKYHILKNYFKNGLPEEVVLTECQENCIAYKNNQLRIENCQLNEIEQKRYQDLQRYFQRETPSEEKINELSSYLSEVNHLKEQIGIQSSKIATLEKINERQNQVKTVGNTPAIYGLFGVALIALIVGIIISRTIPIAGLVCYLMVILFVTLFVYNQFMMKKKKKIYLLHMQQIEGLKNELFKLQRQKESFEELVFGYINKFPVKEELDTIKKLMEIRAKLDEYNTLNLRVKNSMGEVERLNEEQESLLRKIRNVLENYQDNINLLNSEKILTEVKSKRIELIDLEKRIAGYKKAVEETGNVEPLLVGFLSKYFNEPFDSYEELLNEVKENVKDHLRLQKDLSDHIEVMKAFESEYDIHQFDGLEPIEESLIILQEKEKNLTEEIARLNDEINGPNGINNNIASLSVIAEERVLIESEKERLQEELEICISRHGLLEKTVKYLKTAKEQFSTHYLKEINNGFNQYIEQINGSVLKANIDVKLNVKLEEFGANKEVDFYSRGYKDLFGLCTRLALVDALFEHEKPFIILDDPFANLDEEKLSNILTLLNQVAKKYQIIYLVCHSSRVV